MNTNEDYLTLYEIGDLDEILATHAVVRLDYRVSFPHEGSFERFRFYPNGLSSDASTASITVHSFCRKRIASVLIPDTGLDYSTIRAFGRPDIVARLHSRFKTFALYHSEDYSKIVDVEIDIFNREELHANIFCDATTTYRKLFEDYLLLVQIVRDYSVRLQSQTSPDLDA